MGTHWVFTRMFIGFGTPPFFAVFPVLLSHHATSDQELG
jgi:hypothetical protein